MTTYGDLQDISVPLLIQLTCGRGATAVLTLHSQRLESGSITIYKGDIIDASHNSDVGEAAVYSLLRWQEGRFRLVQPTERPLKRTVHKSWKHLLYEGKKRLKTTQFANGTGGTGLLQILPALPELTAEDEQLETALIHLLSVLEHRRGELATDAHLQRPLNVLALLLAMTNTCIEWYGKLRPDPTERSILPAVLGEIRNTHPVVRLFNIQQGRLRADTMQTFYKNWPGSQLARQRMFLDLNDCLMEVMEAYLERLLRKLQGSALAEPWRTSFRNFLMEIDDLLEKVRV